MNTCATRSDKQSCRVDLQRCHSSTEAGFPVIAKDILKRCESWEAKSVIESTLLKSAEILSTFTENTISQTNSDYFDKILIPEAFGFESITPNAQIKEKIKTTNTKSNASSAATGSKKPDISKLPSNIADILLNDSNSSIPSMNKSKKYHYHSKKMALKQRDDPSKEKFPTALTTSNEKLAPTITLVSTPLSLQATDSLTVDLSTIKFQKTVSQNNNNVSQTPLHRGTSIAKYPTERRSNVQSFVLAPITKTEKRLTPNVSSMLRKSDKINLGVGNGVVFVLGTKTKSPYFNTFGDTYLLEHNNRDTSFCRKWVVNIGNFLDNEISLVQEGNTLTITGFRQPSLSYPEGQTVTETIPLPSEININNLRISRSKDAKAFLVIQEKK